MKISRKSYEDAEYDKINKLRSAHLEVTHNIGQGGKILTPTVVFWWQGARKI